MDLRKYLLITIPAFIFLYSGCSRQDSGDRQHEQIRRLKSLNNTAMYWNDRNMDSLRVYSYMLLKEASSANIPRFKVQGFIKVGLYHSNRGATDTAISFFQKALSLADSISDTLAIENAYNYIAGCYFERGLFEKARKGYETALELAQNRQDSVNMARYINNLGSIAEQTNDLPKAQEYLTRSIQITEKLADSLTMASSLRNLGYVLRKTGDSTMARKYLMRSLDLFNALRNHRWMAVLYSDLAISYRYENPDTSYFYYSKAHEIYHDLQDEGNMMIAEFNLANLKLDARRYREAEKAFLMIYHATVKQSNLIGQAYSSLALGDTYTSLHNFGDARKFIDTAESLAHQWGQPDFYIEVYKTKLNLFEITGNHKEAVGYYKKLSHLKDSIQSSVNKSKILEMQKQFDDERKEFTIADLKRESQIQQAQLKNRHIIIGGLTVFILAVSFLLILSYKYYRKSAAANGKLIKLSSELLEEVEKRRKAEQHLKASESELIQTNASKDKFFSIIAHDLKSPFNTIFGFTELLTEDLPDLSREEIVERLENIGRSARQAYVLLENLLIWAQAQRGLLEYSPEEIHLQEHLAEVVSLAETQAKKKGISLNHLIGEDIRIVADRNMFSTVMRNLLSNAIKFTHPGGWVSLSETRREKIVEITVGDNGVGIDQDQIPEIFRIDSRHRTLGTDREKGSGLGLILCREFVEMQGGTIRVESEPGTGTRITVSFPLG